jgi:hypothetical protein
LPFPKAYLAFLIASATSSCSYTLLRGSVELTAAGGSTFIAQVRPYSAALGLAISQACYPMGENHERAVLKELSIRAGDGTTGASANGLLALSISPAPTAAGLRHPIRRPCKMKVRAPVRP